VENINVIIKASYRGYKITFGECNNEWSVKVGEENEAYSNTDIKKVKEYVDRLIKSKFKSIKALGCNYETDTLKEVTINSIDSQDPNYVWITDTEGRRSKYEKKNCYAFTEENLAKIKQMEEIDVKIKTLQKENGKIYKSLTKAP
jgi:hypothetical protein